MVTFLDITLLEQFSSVFIFLMVFALVYALFQTTKTLGDNKSLHAIIAFCFGVFVMFTPSVNHLIRILSPWWVILFLVGTFSLMTIKMFGVTDMDIKSTVMSQEHRYILYFVIIACGILVVFAFSQSFGQTIGPHLDGESTSSSSNSGGLFVNNGTQSTNSGDFNQNLSATIFHPKILGMIVMLLIASFAIRLLANR